jgi:uncharacterized membrane protein YfcA
MIEILIELLLAFISDWGLIELLLAFFLALLVGGLSSITGIGGGSLNVPILVFLFSFDYRVAVGTSLIVMVCSTFTSTLAYIKKRQILVLIALCLAIPGIFASVITANLAAYLPTSLLLAIFALVTFIVGVTMLYPQFRIVFPISVGPEFEEIVQTPSQGKIVQKLYYIHFFVWGFFSGATNGLIGIGGGTFNVPAMIIGGIPIHSAIATSSLVIFCVSCVSSLVHISQGSIASLNIFYVYIAGATIGAFLGAQVIHRISAGWLKTVFGLISIFVSFNILLRLFL